METPRPRRTEPTASVRTTRTNASPTGRDTAAGAWVLVYPRTTVFHETLNFRFADDHDLEMACFPFNVADSAGTISAMMRDLLR